MVDNGRSGTVSGFVDNQGQRALYVDSGVNEDISFDEIDLDYINSAKVIHITSFVGKSDKEIYRNSENCS